MSKSLFSLFSYTLDFTSNSQMESPANTILLRIVQICSDLIAQICLWCSCYGLQDITKNIRAGRIPQGGQVQQYDFKMGEFSNLRACIKSGTKSGLAPSFSSFQAHFTYINPFYLVSGFLIFQNTLEIQFLMCLLLYNPVLQMFDFSLIGGEQSPKEVKRLAHGDITR